MAVWKLTNRESSYFWFLIRLPLAEKHIILISNAFRDEEASSVEGKEQGILMRRLLKRFEREDNRLGDAF